MKYPKLKNRKIRNGYEAILAKHQVGEIYNALTSIKLKDELENYDERARDSHWNIVARVK